MVVKILNNMVLAQTVVALAEALATARRSGLDGALLFDAFAKGSADGFALRNHGMKALLPGDFPLRAFSVEYMLKDLRYALDLAGTAGVEPAGARVALARPEAAAAAGFGAAYWPALYTTRSTRPPADLPVPSTASTTESRAGMSRLFVLAVAVATAGCAAMPHADWVRLGAAP